MPTGTKDQLHKTCTKSYCILCGKDIPVQQTAMQDIPVQQTAMQVKGHCRKSKIHIHQMPTQSANDIDNKRIISRSHSKSVQ
jgi:hypothetical protein